MKKKLVLSLGSNLGNRYAYIYQAIQAINEAFDTISAVSQYYETPPWGDLNQSRFINIALILETDVPVLQCFTKLQAIEAELGRTKTRKWGPRCIDIDILFYDLEIISTPELTIPHPHIYERAFVLAPLCDLMPRFLHPTHDHTVAQLLHNITNDTQHFTP
ncbi:2-amino-4-hydroxy-6-hydroxymethyldihydropteridine diphosphokinase [Bacteroidia bacterium]|nr:2-amino-4-hydroxy-6-hydroxymethyldihydropteridine diphosphokinase [Bacteroidia bacterium]